MRETKISFLLLLWPVLSFSSPSQISSLEKMDSYIEKNGFKLGLALCSEHTHGAYSLGLDMNGWEMGKNQLIILYQGIIGSFHPAKGQYLQENQVPFLKFEHLFGSYFIRALTLSPQFAKACAVCFQKLANDPEILQEEVQKLTRDVLIKDALMSIIPDIAGGALLLKGFRIAKSGVQSTKLLQRLRKVKKGGNTPFSRMSKLRGTQAGRNLSILKKGALIFPLAYAANKVAVANFDFDLKSFLKGEGARKIQEEKGAISTFVEYEKLVPWILLWQKNAIKLSQVLSSEEAYSKESLQSLSSSLALRGIMHTNTFSPKRELLEDILEMVRAVDMEPEGSNLALLLEDLDKWEDTQDKEGKDCPENIRVTSVEKKLEELYQSSEDIFERFLLLD